MKTPVLTLATILSGLSLLVSCAYLPDVGKLLPDKKSEYKKSESMPDVEIPPDLTATAVNDSMNIPGEAPVTLSRYKNPRAPIAADVASGSTETGEQWLTLSMPTQQLWPRLLEFIASENYSVELDDSELGVLETDWSATEEQVGLQYRYKYKIFAEAGAAPDSSTLVISQQRQTRIDDNADWLDQDKDQEQERQFAADLALFLGAGEPAATPVTATPVDDLAARTPQTAGDSALRVVDAGDGKMYLAIPEAFEQAWENTGIALQNSGLEVTGSDPEQGAYQISASTQTLEKKSFFSKMAFWKNDKSASGSWQISLTGVGNKTELIVVNEDNEWEATDDAARLLSLIRDRYPQSR